VTSLDAWNPITISSDEIEVTVLAEKGGDIYSLIDRASGVDVLFKAPWPMRAPGAVASVTSSMEKWIELYPGGWQTLLPNGGTECVIDGVTWPYHGEAAVIPWHVVTATTSRVELETSLITVPLSLRRVVEVEGAVVRVYETLTNESPVDIEVMWSHHPAFGAPLIGEGALIWTGAGTVVADEEIPGSLLEAGREDIWPLATTRSGEQVDLSVVPPADERRSVLAYLTNFSSGYYAIYNPRIDLGVGLRWPRDIFPSAWFWQEFHEGRGWPWFERAYVMAIEPATTYPGLGAVTAKSKGGALMSISAGSRCDVMLEAVLFHGGDEVVSIEPGGVIERSARQTQKI
jgi:Domain of unknown function (DUF4432)